MNVRRALTTAAPLAIAGAIGLGGGIGSASAAALPVQVPGLQLPQLPLVNGLGLGSLTSPLSTVTSTVDGVLGTLGVRSVVPALGGSSATTPSSNAAANGLSLGIIDTCVSCTSASAGSSSAEAGAHALRVLGNDLSAGQISGTGANSGSLIALPANGLLGLAIADWMNSGRAGSNASDAHSRSALTDLSLANGQIATVAVLESLSNAAFGGSSAHGDAANNGVNLSLLNGGVALILLHSDVAADGTQTAYVASLNGQQLLVTHGNSGGLPITIPGVGTINVLSSGASGGAAVSTIENLLGGTGQAAGALTATGGPAAVTTGSNPAGNGGATSTGAQQPTTGALPSASDSSAPTPFTGISLGIGGFALLAGGLGIVAASARRRERVAVI
ncbi:MAG TPA: hypothetical protein VGL20_05595 [Candidatus Dormibacteraeota bacterium]